MTISVTLTVTPSAPAPGAVVTATYAVTGNNPGAGQTIGFSGSVTLGGVTYPGSTGALSLPGTPAAAVSYATPACPGLTFQNTAGNPAVFTATVPATGLTAGPANVSGSASVGGTQYPASATITLPAGSGPSCYFGVWDQGSAYPGTSWAGVQKFSAAPVRSATYYLAWLGPFPAALNTLCAQNNARLYLNLEPWNTWGGGPNPTIADIAAGKYDSYLTQLGQAIKAGGHPVLLTWAHEMNGNGWYPWQQSAGVTPAQWIAGWQHVVTTIRAAARGLALFAWCPNNNDVGPVSPYWPGAGFVDLAAFDGYLNTTSPAQTFGSFIAPTVAEIRKLTSGPVWNAETGVLGTNRSARITQFVADMRSAGLYGFTWFNEGDYLLTAAELGALTTAVNAWDAASS